MKKVLVALILSFSGLFANTCFGQTENYYTDSNCKFIYFEVNSSKLKIFYGNGMEEEIIGKPDLLIATVSNLFLKNGYELNSVMTKAVNGEGKPGYFFFIRKDEK